MASKTLALASAAMESVDADVCKMLAQKAVHINPIDSMYCCNMYLILAICNLAYELFLSS